MELSYTQEQLAFRREVRTFVETALPSELRRKVRERVRLTKQDYLTWQRILHERGWGASTWPRVHGGPGWTPVEQHLFEVECAAGDAPRQLDFGLRMVAPVIMAFGSDDQKSFYLPKIASGEHWWCQGYSEPGSGSDLASLSTRAERAGDAYLVNGQKAWTTLGQHADWIFCLVRTQLGARPQEGISFLLIDMKSPGITVRPTILIDGEHEVNEVYFDSVRVPAANLVGEENRGWTYAKFLLGHERTGLANVAQWKRMLARLKELARTASYDEAPLLDDMRFRDRIAQVEIELLSLEVTMLRVLTAERGKQGIGPVASMLKVRGTEIGQTLFELTMQARGAAGLALVPDALEGRASSAPAELVQSTAAMGDYFNMRKLSIFGGSNEIQRNIIAQMILGL